MDFLAEHRLGHVGLIQAYLLAALRGFLLVRGARAPDPRFWNRVGACVHLAILPAYILHWDFLAEVAGPGMRNAIGIHLAFLTLECVAGFTGPAARDDVQDAHTGSPVWCSILVELDSGQPRRFFDN